MSDSSPRFDGRAPDQLRPLVIEKNIARAAPGSVRIAMGDTELICAVSLDETIPGWMRAQNATSGWLTAEYSMLPYSTSPRSRRDATAGKIGGRTMEIQRLIGRSLRAIVDLEALGPRSLWIDCDVLRADGGTRTAAITGAYIALELAMAHFMEAGKLETNPIREPVAAISVGVVDGRPLLDLNYVEDVAAEVDMNVVMTGSGKFIELQGTAEGEPFSGETLTALQDLARSGIETLVAKQQDALQGA